MFTIPTAIQKAIAEDKLVFFIGSGFSHGLGFPDWKGLVIKIINRLREKGHDYSSLLPAFEEDLITAIEILGKIEEHKGTVFDILEETFELNDKVKKLIEEQEKFSDLWKASSKIITTNYDRVLETAGDLKASDIVKYDTQNSIKNLSSKESFLFKIHGDFADSAKCVLFQSDYQTVYEKESASILELKKIISDKTIIFIGFSMTDPFVSNLFGYIKELYNELKGMPHYIITTKDEDFKEYGVEQIKLNSFDELPIYIKELANFKLQKTPPTKVIEPLNGKKAAILVANPIATNYDYSIQLKAIKKLKINFDIYHLSYETLNELNDYDYLFIFTKLIKNKVVIEDEYLDQRLIPLQEMEDNIVNSDTKAIFLFLDKAINPKQVEKLMLPIIIYPELSKAEIQKVLFEAFNKKFQPYEVEGCQILNKLELNLNKLQGQINIHQAFTPLPDEIDKKSTTNFIGRATDLKNITREILELQEEEGILTIKGSGGIGKTHTIKKIAVALAERSYFKDGIDFIDCEFIEDHKSFEFRILNVFNLEQSQDPVSYIKYNELNKDALIILDNFETLLHVNDSEQIISFLNFICDYATVVVTSREILDLDWERAYELRSMSTDEAVKLFLHGMADCVLQSSEKKYLRENIIENLLDNNPLAITLVTKNIPKGKRLEALKEDLEEDVFNKESDVELKIFESESDTNIERKRSLYASINFSYELLNDKEKMAFELVSLFPDGISIENLKKVSQQKQGKIRNSKKNKETDLGITDRVIRALEKKSMLESNNNTVKLQSIVGKFAEHKLTQRDNMSAIFQNAFEYNRAVAQFCQDLEKKDTFLSNKLFSEMMNNFLKSVNYVDRFDYDKKEIIIYLSTLSNEFNDFCANQNFIDAIKGKREFFVGNDKLLYEMIILSLKYFGGEFDKSLLRLQELIPFEEIYKFDYTDQVEARIVNKAMSLYSMEGESLKCAEYYFNKNQEGYSYSTTMFYLGEYDLFFNNPNEKDFFIFEAEYNVGILKEDQLEVCISKLHKKHHLERMELYYLKAKLGGFDRDVVKKLVEVNPFTSGLKQLIFAFNEIDVDKANTLYLNAIENLRHIKYYYIEANYFYAKFLKELSDNKLFEKVYNEGLSFSKKYNYRFLIYKFEDLKINKETPYNSKDYPLPDDINFKEN